MKFIATFINLIRVGTLPKRSEDKSNGASRILEVKKLLPEPQEIPRDNQARVPAYFYLGLTFPQAEKLPNYIRNLN